MTTYTEKRDRALKNKVTELSEQMKHIKKIRNQIKAELLEMQKELGTNPEVFKYIKKLLELCDEV
jgi:hypothetical protein